jgi:hypothetical protein
MEYSDLRFKVLNPPEIPLLAYIYRFSWQHLSRRGKTLMKRR